MTEIELYSTLLPKKIQESLIPKIFGTLDPNDSIELTIKIEGSKINIKDFSTYLHFIYRIDGMLSELGFLSYSKFKNHQIEITRIEHGSIDIIIEKLLHEVGADRLVIIWLSLKYIPTIVNSVAETGTKIYETLLKREDYLEKKQKRKLRKQIRDLINEEVELTELNKASKEKLVNLLDELFVRNSKELKSASTFAKENVKSVMLKAKTKNNS